MSRDVAASVRARLLNRAKETNEEFELFLVRYAVERFLHRLGASRFRDRCILKGATLFALWMDDPYRATRDLDLLTHGPNDEATVRAMVKTVCDVHCQDDGLRFDVSSIDVSRIQEFDRYGGERVVLSATLGSARIRLQIDFAFGDAVSPAAIATDFPALVPGLPVARIWAYSKENTLSEKVESMVDLGRRNSRMKDFHDLWALTSSFSFEGSVMQESLAACIERRGTDWTSETPECLEPDFYDDAVLRKRWSAYLASGSFRIAPARSFARIGERMRRFVLPIRAGIIAGTRFAATWPPSGPWNRA